MNGVFLSIREVQTVVLSNIATISAERPVSVCVSVCGRGWGEEEREKN